MSTYYANDKYNAVLTAGYSVGQTTLYVSAVPNNVPTVIVAAKGTDNETVFAVTDKTTNSLTGVSRLRGANVDLDAQTPLTCLNNEEFINQSAAVDAIFYEEHDETGKHTTDQINEKTADAGVTVDGLKIKDGRVVAWDGWMPAEETWTYSSWDSTVYTGVITVPSGAAGKYSVGMRIKISQSTGGTKYGIITKVADTALTVFFGTDYTLNNETITNPYYSTQKAPLGFPLGPTKWTVEVVDANQRATSNPSDGVWYNATSIDIPVGCWEVEYKAVGNFREAANVAAIFTLTLSTANNSESDNRFSYTFNIGILANPSQVIISMSLPRNPLALSSKTTYYLNYSIGGSGIDYARVRGDSIPTIIRAICAYL